MKNNYRKTIVLISGGLDSATTTALALEKGDSVIGLSFDYGQKHKKELNAAKKIIKYFDIKEHYIITVNFRAWGGSSITDHRQSIPNDGVKQDTIPNTYVPGRNTVFISIGLSLAEAKQANRIGLGINAMDYSGYPDCRPDYLKSFQQLADLSSKTAREGKKIELWAPLVQMNKVKIIKEAIRLKVPIEMTWSCYVGDEQPCGLCDSCRIRNQALKDAGYQYLIH